MDERHRARETAPLATMPPPGDELEALRAELSVAELRRLMLELAAARRTRWSRSGVCSSGARLGGADRAGGGERHRLGRQTKERARNLWAGSLQVGQAGQILIVEFFFLTINTAIYL